MYPKTEDFKDVQFPVDLCGPASIHVIYEMNPKVFFVISRKFNGNVMVYSAVTKNNKMVGVEMYWLDLEHSYRIRARKKGRKHDRDEVTLLQKVGYGFKANPLNIDQTLWNITFAKMNSYNITIEFNEEKQSASAYIDKEKTKKLHHVYLEDSKNPVGIPTVKKVRTVYFDKKTKSVQTNVLVL